MKPSFDLFPQSECASLNTYERVAECHEENMVVFDRIEAGLDILFEKYDIKPLNYRSGALSNEKGGYDWHVTFKYEGDYGHLFEDAMILMHSDI